MKHFRGVQIADWQLSGRQLQWHCLKCAQEPNAWWHKTWQRCLLFSLSNSLFKRFWITCLEAMVWWKDHVTYRVSYEYNRAKVFLFTWKENRIFFLHSAKRFSTYIFSGDVQKCPLPDFYISLNIWIYIFVVSRFFTVQESLFSGKCKMPIPKR